MRGQTFRLQEDLVAVFVRKAVDLVFHAGAVAWAYALNLAGEHGAAVKAAADDFVRALVGVRDPAGHLLRVHGRIAAIAENRHLAFVGCTRHAIAGLNRALAEVNGTPIDARWCPRLQAPLRQLQLFQACRQAHGRRIARAATSMVVQAHMDLAIQEGAGGQHHGLAAELDAHLRDGTDHAVALHHQVVHRLLEQPQIRLVFQHFADGRFVQNAVSLCPRSAHGGAFGTVQNAELDTTDIGGQRHRTAHGIYFLDQMALADATDGRVARHLTQCLNVVGQ